MKKKIKKFIKLSFLNIIFFYKKSLLWTIFLFTKKKLTLQDTINIIKKHDMYYEMFKLSDVSIWKSYLSLNDYALGSLINELRNGNIFLYENYYFIKPKIISNEIDYISIRFLSHQFDIENNRILLGKNNFIEDIFFDKNQIYLFIKRKLKNYIFNKTDERDYYHVKKKINSHNILDKDVRIITQIWIND